MDFKRFAKRLVKRVMPRQAQFVKQVMPRQANSSGENQLSTKLQQDIRLLFNEEYYLQENPDVLDAGVDPFQHYLSHGVWEERQPSPLFNPSYYQDQVTGLAGPSVKHFLEKGGLDGLNPIPQGFDSRWYLERHPEVARARMNPLIHYLRKGRSSGFDPSPIFSVVWYRKQNADVLHGGIDPLSHYLWQGFQEGRTPSASGPRWAPVADTAMDFLERVSKGWSPIRTRPVPAHDRITIVTDAIDPSHLFGGVATSIIFASLWANATGRSLRVLTRTAQPQQAGLQRMLATMGIELEKPLELAYAPLSSDSEDLIPASESDIFLTTSWWTTQATLASVPSRRIVYLLQEDERAFYPVGSDWLRANTMMNCPEITVLVNTQGLLTHLIDTKVDNLADNGYAFTPSFSSFTYPGRRLADRGERLPRICFYARPKNPRNLFMHGLSALDQAIGKGIITDEMEVVFMGTNLQAFRFMNGSVSSIVENLSWDEYREFVRTVDVGISLMASPHPSYPPFDMLASGAVVLTNLWPGKPSLGGSLKRVVEVNPTVTDIIDGIAQAIDMMHAVENEPYEVDNIPFFQSWQQNLKDSIEWVERRVTGV